MRADHIHFMGPRRTTRFGCSNPKLSLFDLGGFHAKSGLVDNQRDVSVDEVKLYMEESRGEAFSRIGGSRV